MTSGHSTGHGVIVGAQGHKHLPGGGGVAGEGAGGGSGKPLTQEQLQALWDAACAGAGDCGMGAGRGSGLLNPILDTTPAAPGAGGAAPVTVTVSDVARFLPADAVLHEEPVGWAVTGVPANFWVDVQAVTVQAPLLGTTADVRFTPELYRWDYGDGGVRGTDTPGASWAALGQQDLTATATSHVYTARAHREASVAVIYAAEYRIGGGAWLPVLGAVEGDPPPRPVLVVNERTVLTNGR